MRRFRSPVIVAIALLGFLGISAGLVRWVKPVLAQVPGAQVLNTLTGGEYIQNWNATVSQLFSSATLAGYTRSTALLYTTLTAVPDAALNTEQTLASYSLPGGTLSVGTKLRILASFSAGADGNNKTFKCYFGASVISSGVLTTNAKNGSCELIVTKIAAAAQIAYGNMLVDTTPITGYVNLAGSDNDASAITIKFTGTNGSSVAGDIVLNDFSVERLGK